MEFFSKDILTRIFSLSAREHISIGYVLSRVNRRWRTVYTRMGERRCGELAVMVGSSLPVTYLEWCWQKFLRSQNIVWSTCVSNASTPEILRWCWSKSRFPDGNDLCAAARFGMLDDLKRLLTKVPWYDGFTCDAALYGQADVVLWAQTQRALPPYIMTFAVPGGNVQLVRKLVELGYATTKEGLQCAASNGDLEMVQFLSSQGQNLTPIVFAEAVASGHWPLLQWLLAVGCPWDARVCARAVQLDRLDILKWLRGDNAQKLVCPWHKIRSEAYEHADIMAWLREIGEVP